MPNFTFALGFLCFCSIFTLLYCPCRSDLCNARYWGGVQATSHRAQTAYANVPLNGQHTLPGTYRVTHTVGVTQFVSHNLCLHNLCYTVCVTKFVSHGGETICVKHSMSHIETNLCIMYQVCHTIWVHTTCMIQFMSHILCHTFTVSHSLCRTIASQILCRTVCITTVCVHTFGTHAPTHSHTSNSATRCWDFSTTLLPTTWPDRPPCC